MKQLTRAIALVLGSLGCAASVHAAGGGPALSDGRYVIVFKSATLPVDAALRIASNGGAVARGFEQIGVAVARGDAAFAKRMSRDRAVLAVGVEGMSRLPESISMPLAIPESASTEGAPTAADTLYNAYQWDMRRIGAPAVWARLPVAATEPRVAVLDTGVMDNHPDLLGQVERSVSTAYCNTPGGPSSSAGYPTYSTLIDFDAYPAWSQADGCTAASTAYESHGTHVAGTIAANFGGGAVVGVAPDAKVGAYKVFDRYRYTDPVEGVIEDFGAFDGPLFDAIIQATLAGYPVISMSLGGHLLRSDKSGNATWLAWDRVTKWANRHGALLVASSGNAGLYLNGQLAHIPSDLAAVMSTSATGTSLMQVVGGAYYAAPGLDVLAFYSNYGSSVDIAAPGGDCGPTDPSGCAGRHFIANAGISASGAATYLLYAGTSMATPHVSAVAAYVRSIHPEWTPGETRSWLKETAQPIGSRQSFGAGMVDADAAVN